MLRGDRRLQSPAFEDDGKSDEGRAFDDVVSSGESIPLRRLCASQLTHFEMGSLPIGVRWPLSVCCMVVGLGLALERAAERQRKKLEGRKDQKMLHLSWDWIRKVACEKINDVVVSLHSNRYQTSV